MRSHVMIGRGGENPRESYVVPTRLDGVMDMGELGEKLIISEPGLVTHTFDPSTQGRAEVGKSM